MTGETRVLLQRAIDHSGEGTQLVKAMEELSELVQAVAKYTVLPSIPATDAEAEAMTRAMDHVAEEIADVRIMLDQLEMITDTHDRAARWRWKKLMRLRQRLDEEDGHGEDL